jgi:hypothetical protein
LQGQETRRQSQGTRGVQLNDQKKERKRERKRERERKKVFVFDDGVFVDWIEEILQ